MKSIYELQPHEVAEIRAGVTVVRVPGGWIYQTAEPTHNILNQTFVPYNDEFEPKPMCQTCGGVKLVRTDGYGETTTTTYCYDCYEKSRQKENKEGDWVLGIEAFSWDGKSYKVFV